MKKPTTIPIPTSEESPAEHEEKIRKRAFEIYERRGREDGRELEDWLEAEKEVLEAKTA